MNFDVIIVGGSFAGLSAALYLARARRNVLVLDSGEPRNRYTSHSHGVFALDGQPGSELLEVGRSQLLEYPTATLLHKKATHVSKEGHLFQVETEDKQLFQSRRLILATGLIDEPPGDTRAKGAVGKNHLSLPLLRRLRNRRWIDWRNSNPAPSVGALCKTHN